MKLEYIQLKPNSLHQVYFRYIIILGANCLAPNVFYMIFFYIFQVEGYGEVWVISPDWANVQVEGNGFTLYGNSRMYFASSPTDGFDANSYWQVRVDNLSSWKHLD